MTLHLLSMCTYGLSIRTQQLLDVTIKITLIGASHWRCCLAKQKHSSPSLSLNYVMTPRPWQEVAEILNCLDSEERQE